uniref:Uncharacterized protein n=1 Tax=Spongospora subterranea TaxID=70186 RepID=A0A0H5RAM5_9EUKA|eukprot:CRZ10821.1 hypothetical protein [Spongospora subterranea]
MDLSISDFQGEFNELDFLQKITNRIHISNGAEPHNPAPYQAAFAQALNSIDALERTVAMEIQRSSKELFESEKLHQQNLVGHSQALEAVIERFAKLDQRISSVAQTAVRIGDQLELIDKSKQRSAYNSKMISYFLAMNSNHGDVPAILTSQKLEDLKEAAGTIQVLQQASQDLARMPNTENAIKNISQVAGEIENRLLLEFEEAWEADHIPGMTACAAPLLEFEGGHLIARFISKCVSDLGPVTVTDPPTGIEQFTSQSARLFGAIAELCEAHFPRIVEVFPAAEKVIRQLIERIYEDNVASFLENGLASLNTDPTAYLSALEFGYDANRKLIRELTSLSQELELRESIVSAVRLTLQDHTEGLFCQYRDAFLSKQLDVLYRETKQRLDNALAFTPINIDSLQSSVGMSSSMSGVEPGLGEWINGVFQTNVFDGLLVFYQTALTRCDKLCDPPRMPDLVRRVYKILLDAAGKQFLLRLADALLSIVSEEYTDTNSEPDASAIEFAGDFDAIMQKLEFFFQSEIALRLQDSLNILQNCSKEKNELSTALEAKLSVALGTTNSAVIQYCSKTLSRLQQKTDFRPKEDSVLPDGSGCSVACTEVVTFMQNHTASVLKSLKGRNLDQYLLILGIRLYDLITGHLKSYTISNAGALLLMRDIREYQDCLRDFHVPAVSDRFETLRHIANVFAVPADGLRSLITDDPTLSPSHIPREELHLYVKLRADYKQANLKRYFQ